MAFVKNDDELAMLAEDRLFKGLGPSSPWRRWPDNLEAAKGRMAFWREMAHAVSLPDIPRSKAGIVQALSDRRAALVAAFQPPSPSQDPPAPPR